MMQATLGKAPHSMLQARLRLGTRAPRWFPTLFVVAWASVAWSAPPTPEPPRPGWTLVLQDDCGKQGQQPHLTTGANWSLTAAEKQGGVIADDRYLDFAHHEQAVVLRYVGLRPEAHYLLRVHYFNVSHERTVRLSVDGEELHGPLALPMGKGAVREFEVPAGVYRDGVIQLVCEKKTGPNALISAVELWSDTAGVLGPVGSFVRFRVRSLPQDKKKLDVQGLMKIHHSPWNTRWFPIPAGDMTAPGFTPWVNLAKLPGNANGSLILKVPDGVRGATQFSVVGAGDACIREIDWKEPDGTKIIIDPAFSDVRTFREQQRRYYQNALSQNGDRLRPLSRPPLMFSNAWGHATGAAAEYMVKTFRVLGFNSVATGADGAKYEQLYGWHSQGGQYGPPGFLPFDEAQASSRFTEYYRNFFSKTGRGAATSPGMRVFQLADEPGEAPLKDTPEARAGFQTWLKTKKDVTPELFGKKAWDEVHLFPGKPTTLEEKKLHSWTRLYQRYLTPRMFALASDAVRSVGPAKDTVSYVALSGHAMNFPSRQQLDMFQLAQYPGLMPGISDWMTGGSWWWDSHQSVAYSVAPFNAGARRYGKDFGKPPLSFPMMHCVNPSMLRAYTQLASNCKLISYYNYGPDYEATEGFWSHTPWMYSVVGEINNRAAQVDDILGPGTMRPSRVAMLYTDVQEIWWAQGSFADKRAAFLAMSHEYYQPELITEQQVRDGALEHYDALYVLDQFVSRPVQDRIEGWVKQGGLLWSCADAAIGDEYNEPWDLLERLGGIKRDRKSPPTAEVRIEPVAGETTFTPHPVPLRGRSKEVIRPGLFECADARVRARYSDNQPAWIQKQIGKGTLVYLGHRCGLAYSRRTGKRGAFAWWPQLGRELLTIPLHEAKVPRELSLSVNQILASPLSTEAGTVVVIFDLNTPPSTDVVVTLKEPHKPHSVQMFDDGTNLVDVPFEYADGAVRVTLKQIPWKGQLLVVRRQPPPKDDRLETMHATASTGLSSTDWQTASAAAWFTGFYPEWKLAPRLLPLLRHEHWAVRCSAAESLGRLVHTQAGEELRAAIDKETDAHAIADELAALARIGHPDAKSLCQKYARHDDPFLKSESARAAGFLANSTSAASAKSR